MDTVINPLWTLHAETDAMPWVPLGPGIDQKMVQARPAEGFLVTVSRYHPNFTHGVHRHRGPVFGYTIMGAWGHEPHTYPYRPGVFLYEPVGVVHSLFNGPGMSAAIFVNHGDVELLDPETMEVMRTETAATVLQRYYERCEAAGLPRGNVLG